jgi:hypothetical protein
MHIIFNLCDVHNLNKPTKSTLFPTNDTITKSLIRHSERTSETGNKWGGGPVSMKRKYR